jgi:Cd2+/Zn2+-exporting ATPase
VLEAIGKVKHIAFDKTGTLTEGRPTVVAVHAVDCQDPDQLCPPCEELLALASAVERRSEHPMAHAVVAAAQHHQLFARYPVAENVVAQVGQGVQGAVNGQEVIIGSHAYFDRAVPHSPEQCTAIAQQAAQGQTLLLVKAHQQFAGYIAVADTVRASSRAAIAALHQAGVSALVMLTGDNESAAQAIASQVGGLAVQANLLPADKVQAIQTLRAQHKSVAMVGDGVNDAPALATANVGVAMGAGTAQALETADITLMSDDLRKLPWALAISRAAMRTIRANIAFSIGIKLAFLALVLAGLGSMWLAVLADVGAALLVTLNGMRLLKFK